VHHHLFGRKLALVSWCKDAAGRDVMSVDTGTVTLLDCEFLLDRGVGKPPLRLRFDWMHRIEAVTGDLKSTMPEADFMLALDGGRQNGTSSAAYGPLE
jgi:hypothetical protein